MARAPSWRAISPPARHLSVLHCRIRSTILRVRFLAFPGFRRFVKNQKIECGQWNFNQGGALFS
jgi:hypothetical protein